MDEVLELTSNLKGNNSPGLDAIQPRVLKELEYETSDLLTIICNFATKFSLYREDWKVVDVMLFVENDPVLWEGQ